ncbi:hypothetical protein FZO89_00295 [Luteimonas viscosa]|uniref:Uncharacterized protein n=1 Tax=Luteimonas viscosa TaxID=1132694 RepID=A0A5D4XL43_9GAMM|nr:hypothetical protein [Luteimonas viscosa]TYT24844.1 hypothetical protein FZO89_00295 [Luteimonas viscosa]
MDSASFVWDHFKLNAEQRLKSFNFFLLLSIFANGGVFTAIQNRVASPVLGLLGLFVALLALVFWLADARSRQLIQLTIPALKEIESTFPESHRLFAIDAARQGKLVRYTFAFRILMAAQFLFGIGVALYGFLY